MKKGERVNEEVSNRILIVDDKMLNVEILVQILEKEFDISIATSGKQALEIVQKMPPDLILLDIMMPEMNGFEVCTTLKGDEKTCLIPVIFVTAMDDEINERKGLEAGACDYITKPVNSAIVLARVKIHLQNRMYAEFLELLLSEKTHQLDLIKQTARKLEENLGLKSIGI